MIYTLTTNPAVDINVNAGHLSTDHVNRTTDAVFTPNGKGLNVSFVLKHFNVDSKILGFFGGFSGRYIIEGAEKICPVSPVHIDGITRVNMFVTTPDGEYKFPNAGAPVSKDKQKEMLELIKNADDLEYLVVSGSLSPEIEPTFYDELLQVVRSKGGEVILDISHRYLADLVKSENSPLLIKPNDEEVAEIFGIDVSDSSKIINGLKQLHDIGARNILLTLGGNGAYFSNGKHIWRAEGLKVQVLSTACAGDATLGSFLSIWLSDREAVKTALKRAMAVGANVAESAGLGNFEHVSEYEKLVKVSCIC